LKSNSFPPKLGRVHEEGGNLTPTPTCQVKGKLVQFPKEQCELGMGTPSCQSVPPLTHGIHPKKAIGGDTLLAFGFTYVKVKYCKPMVDLGMCP